MVTSHVFYFINICKIKIGFEEWERIHGTLTLTFEIEASDYSL